tara:strand:+ start:344 stop:538 length:195 start_codon:yes stop_codon:yes gene_type:complete
MSEKKTEEKSEQELVQDFINEYNELTQKHGLQIVVVPAWKARDDGTFSLIQQNSIGKIAKNGDK